MFFIGQKHLLNQLNLALPKLYYEGSAAFLLRGPSGYGKTHLAKLIASYIAGKNYSFQLASTFSGIKEDIRVHFIDEIHTLSVPYETLYPIIDSNRFVFIFATNFDSILPEAFQNRCINLNFTSYSKKEFRSIFRVNSRLPLSDNVVNFLYEVSGGNPRILIKVYIYNLELFFEQNPEGLSKSDDEIIKIIEDIHGIKDYLTRDMLEYLKVLDSLGGRAPIDTIASGLKLDRNTIKYDIEPVLLFRKRIKISSKGRELC